MKIIQAMGGKNEGGAELFFERMVIAFHKRGIEQKILIRKTKNKNRLNRLVEAGLDVVELPFSGMLDFTTKKKYKKIIQEFNPDCTLNYLNRATIACPKINGIANFSKVGGYYDKKYYKNMDKIICNTPDLVKFFEDSGVVLDKLKYIPNFVVENGIEAVKKEDYDTPADAKVIFGLGRLHVNKAWDVLIKSFSKIKDKNTYLWIGGNGPEEEYLKSVAKSENVENRVKFLGWVTQNEIGKFFKAVDFYVVPSRHEPFGSIILEGWAYQVPMVSSKSQGGVFLVDNEKNGLLYEIDDVEELTEKIDLLMSDKNLADKMVKNGYKKFRDEFTEDAVIDAYLSYIEKNLNV